MKHELLFRGKVLTDGQWIVGSSIDLCSDGSASICSNGVDYVQVVPKTVGMLVCKVKLRDRKTVPIFEHDIVQFERESATFPDPVVVIYDFDASGYVFYSVRKDGGAIFDTQGHIYPVCGCVQLLKEKIKILGNVHDNPELVEWDEEKMKYLL
ncbi:MAG: hypothetical protein IJG38_02050 [Thermoguttaceae bacterium]|nr:hypothetical protein [Thermoguttaceae bacterium]